MEEHQQQPGPEPEAQDVDGAEVLEDIMRQTRETIRQAARLSEKDWPNERLDALARTIMPEGAKPADIAMFLGVSDRYGLDPILGEIWLVWDEKKKKFFVMTGRDAYLSIADRHPDYEGFDNGVVYENDGFEIVRDGSEITIRHIIGKDRGKRLRGYCVCYRKGRRPILIVRDWIQYASLHGKKNWRNNPDDMLETRVITQAHRLQFRIPGIYVQGEVDAAEPVTTDKARTPNGAEATKTRMDELRQQVRKQDGVEESTPEQESTEGPPTVERIDFAEKMGRFQESLLREEEKPVEPINILAFKVEFGKYASRGWTWGEAFENDPNVVGYLRRWVLSDVTEHPILTPEVRKLLAVEVDKHEARIGHEKPEPEPESVGEGAEAPQPSEEQDTALEAVYEEAQAAATDLAKLGALRTEDADEMELLLEEKDLESLAKIRDRLRGEVKRHLDQGADLELGF